MRECVTHRESRVRSKQPRRLMKDVRRDEEKEREMEEEEGYEGGKM